MDVKRIALIVQEPVPGHFYWVLQQQDPRAGRACSVASAPAPMPSYGLAMMAGISAMQRRTHGRQGNADTLAEDERGATRTDFGPTTIQ